MNIWQIMGESPWLSFFAVIFLAQCAATVCSRVLRSINVAVRGWPPSHLDADGDWKPDREAGES
jgi:hypothetical protein